MSFLDFLFKPRSSANESIQLLDATEFRKAIANQRGLLVDVRTAGEFKGGHLPKAAHVDFFDKANFNKWFETKDKNQPVYLYCRSGNRSHKAAKRLSNMGFTKIVDLKGGYMAWQRQ